MASYLLGKQLFHDGHSGMSRAGDPGQLLEAKHSPPPGSESLANHVLCRSAVTAGYFEKVFPLNLPHWLLFSSVLPCHYFPYIFSSLLNRDIIETGVERSLGLRNKLWFLDILSQLRTPITNWAKCINMCRVVTIHFYAHLKPSRHFVSHGAPQLNQCFRFTLSLENFNRRKQQFESLLIISPSQVLFSFLRDCFQTASLALTLKPLQDGSWHLL